MSEPIWSDIFSLKRHPCSKRHMWTRGGTRHVNRLGQTICQRCRKVKEE